MKKKEMTIAIPNKSGMIDKTQFEELRKFETASWAIWNDRGLDDLQFFTQHIDALHGDFILLGLNRSGRRTKYNGEQKNEKYEFSNFHTANHKSDKNLKNTIMRLDKIRGSYMTDLFLEIEGDSRRINKQKVQLDEPLNNFFQQIKILRSTSFKIICFGNKTFGYLLQMLNINKSESNIENKYENIKIITKTVEHEKTKFDFRIYRVYHYSCRFKDYSKSKFSNQMSFINYKIM